MCSLNTVLENIAELLIGIDESDVLHGLYDLLHRQYDEIREEKLKMYKEKEVHLNRLKLAKRDGKGSKRS